MKLQKIIYLLIALGLIVTESGCIDKLKNPLPDTENIQSNNNSDNNDSIEKPESPTTPNIISNKIDSNLKIERFEVQNNNENNPFKIEVTNFKVYNNFILVTIEITKTYNFNPNKNYSISITSPHSEILLRLDDISSGLEHAHTYMEQGDDWARGFELRVSNTDTNKYRITVAIGSTKSNIVYNEFKRYALLRITYLEKKTTTGYINIGYDLIYGIYNS